MKKDIIENMVNDLISCIHSEYWYKISCYKQRVACYENSIRIIYMEWLKSRGMNEVNAFYRSGEIASSIVKKIEKEIRKDKTTAER